MQYSVIGTGGSGIAIGIAGESCNIIIKTAPIRVMSTVSYGLIY